MSGFDPLAAIAADAVSASTEALATAAIDLLTFDALQAQINVGDILTATVLPPQNGNDQLSLLGQTVVAQLPPGVFPGETLELRVTGFAGNQILVQNLAAQAASSAPDSGAQRAVLTTQLPAPNALASSSAATTAPGSSAPTSASNLPAQSPSTASPLAAPTAPGPTAPSAPSDPRAPSVPPTQVAPSREIFVAASVRTNVRGGEGVPAPSNGPNAHEVPADDLEARIAITRAARESIPQRREAAGAPARVAEGARAPQRLVPPARLAPPIAARLDLTQARAGAQSREATLLGRLRIPLTTNALAVARVARDAGAVLAKTFARIDELLARVTTGDARVATLRSLLSFAGRFDLANARALPEQIASFVSNVLDAPEAKLATIARALEEAQSLPANAPQADAAQSAPNPSPEAVTVNAQAHAAERIAALPYDVKTALVQLLQSPPQGAPPQLAQALGDAIAATSALQLNTLNSLVQHPNTISLTLPATFYDGGRPVELRISRDADGSRGKLDADTFHIAFVLDTRSLGTVAVDLQTAGRNVNVSVKTETTSAADRFRVTLDDLRSRFEALRYRIAALSATTAPFLHVDREQSTSAHAESSLSAPQAPTSSTSVDIRA